MTTFVFLFLLFIPALNGFHSPLTHTFIKRSVRLEVSATAQDTENSNKGVYVRIAPISSIKVRSKQSENALGVANEHTRFSYSLRISKRVGFA